MSRRPKTILEKGSHWARKDEPKISPAEAEKLSADACKVFNTASYSVDELAAGGLSRIASIRFASEYLAISEYLRGKAEAVELFKALNGAVSEHVAERNKDWRYAAYVTYDFTTTIMIAFIGCLLGFTSIKKWIEHLNSNISTRALITALFPKALNPSEPYDHNSVYRIIAMFAEASYGEREEANQAKGGAKALHDFLKNLKLFQGGTEVDLFSYAPLSGFLNGATMRFSSKRYICIGFDGQELRASFLPEDGSSRENFTSVNLFDCTHMCSIDFRIRTKKNHEREAFLEMLEELVKDGIDLSMVVFVADALNTTTEIVDAIQDAGAHYLLTIKNNNGNKALRALVHQGFKDLDANEIKTYTSQVQKAHGRIEQVTVQAISCTQLQSKPDLFNPEALHANLSDPLSKYQGIKSIIKFDKQSEEYRNSYSEEGLAALNAEPVSKAESEKEQMKRHRVMITDIDISEGENFEKILCVLNELWMYEVGHYFTDENLDQDRLQMSAENRIITRVGFNKIALDFGLHVREQMQAAWNAVPGHNRKRKPSLQDAYAVLSDPINLLDYLCSFLHPTAKTQGLL